MLELRPSCENCGKVLLPNSTEAMICTFECTFCEECVTNILHNVCPNCGGGFEKRPIRPREKLLRNPARVEPVFKPVEPEKFDPLLAKNRNIKSSDR
jgi:uncharacterized protein